VCCGSACAGPCEACNLPGSAGACTAAVAGTDPANECGGGLCDGAGRCLSSSARLE
jgi:hypothetical protein